MRTAKLTGQVVALAAVAGLLGLLVWRLTHQSHPPKVGGPAPAFSALQLRGDGRLALRSLRGKAVVINFFQSYCVPCKSEAPALQQAYAQYRKQGVVFLGVDYWDSIAAGRKFVDRHGVTYLVVRDPGGTVADRYGVTGTPETFFVDRRGRLVGAHILGPINEGSNRTLFRESLAVAAKRT
jgi:cytochrome c biogenesis protein CcmG, thiol:disulfide interchange protein DsbE